MICCYNLLTPNILVMTDEEAMEDVGPYLNADCIALIFQYLNCYELVRVSTMCKLWKNVGSFTLSTISHIAIGKNSIPEEILINILKQNNGNLKSLNLYGKSSEYNDLTENKAKAIKDYCPNLRKLTACHNLRLTSLPTFFSNMPDLSDICFVVTMDDDVQQNIVFNVIMPFLKKLGIKRKQGHVVLETESSLLNFHGSLAMTPNLTHILLNGITLNTDFNRIGNSCPNLEVVKVSGCGYERGVACFLPSLKGLNLTELDLRLFDRNQFEYRYPTEDSRIDFVVDCLVDFKRLEVLNVTMNRQLTNGHVVRLITQLPHLRRIVFGLCHKVNEDLVPLLNAQPELKDRNLHAVHMISKGTRPRVLNIVDSEIQVYFAKGSLAQ